MAFFLSSRYVLTTPAELLGEKGGVAFALHHDRKEHMKRLTNKGSTITLAARVEVEVEITIITTIITTIAMNIAMNIIVAILISSPLPSSLSLG
jgi:hypothetical protein